MASTLPGELPFGSQAWLSDLPGWCVDLGPTLRAMTTCELWLALAKGEVRPEMKVWREGMACWEPVAHVPEFALALPDADVWSPSPTVGPRAFVSRIAMKRAITDTAAASARTPAAGAVIQAADAATMAPPSDFATPAPVVVEHDDAPPAPPAPRRLLPRLDRRGAASMVIGAMIAITALAVATTGPGPSSAAGPVGAGAQPAGIAWSPRPAQTFESLDALTAPASAAPARPKAPRGPHASDRGQRRARAAAR